MATMTAEGTPKTKAPRKRPAASAKKTVGEKADATAKDRSSSKSKPLTKARLKNFLTMLLEQYEQQATEEKIRATSGDILKTIGMLREFAEEEPRRVEAYWIESPKAKAEKSDPEAGQ